MDTALFSPGPRDEALASSLNLDCCAGHCVCRRGAAEKGIDHPAARVCATAYSWLCASQLGSNIASPTLLLIGGVRKDDEPILQVFRRQNPTLNVRVVPNMAHEELPAYYRLADVLVIPSLRDGMPNSLLEGMACERAIVASNVGGMPDVLRDGENGVLVPPGDVNALADATARVVNRSIPSRATRTRGASDGRIGFHAREREIERNLEIYQHVKRET